MAAVALDPDRALWQPTKSVFLPPAGGWMMRDPKTGLSIRFVKEFNISRMDVLYGFAKMEEGFYRGASEALAADIDAKIVSGYQASLLEPYQDDQREYNRLQSLAIERIAPIRLPQMLANRQEITREEFRKMYPGSGLV